MFDKKSFKVLFSWLMPGSHLCSAKCGVCVKGCWYHIAAMSLSVRLRAIVAPELTTIRRGGQLE